MRPQGIPPGRPHHLVQASVAEHHDYGAPMVIARNVAERREQKIIQERYLNYKRQRWDVCEEWTARHFGTKFPALKFLKPWMSSRQSSEWRNPNFDGSTTWPKGTKKDRQGKSWLTSRLGYRCSTLTTRHALIFIFVAFIGPVINLS